MVDEPSIPSSRALALLPPAVLSALVKTAVSRDVAAGTTLFSRGDPATNMLIIERGHVDVHLEDGEPPKRFEAGTLVGELALLTPMGTRTATVVAGANCRIVVIDRTQFDALLQERPELARPALLNACSYLVESERRLVAGLRRRNAELEGALDYLRRTREELDATELRAQTDALTELYNRRCFDRQLPRFMEAARSGHHGLAVLMIDLDKFKPINDTHGHAAGDAVLRGVASVLRRTVRATDLACRIGGDEFAVLLSPVTPGAEDVARSTAARLRQAIAANEVHVPAGVLKVGATIGAAFWTDADSAESVLARADKHLYAAKQAGRNLVCWDGTMLANDV